MEKIKHPKCNKLIGAKATYIPELKTLLVYPKTELTLRKLEIRNGSSYHVNAKVRVEEGILFIDIINTV